MIKHVRDFLMDEKPVAREDGTVSSVLSLMAKGDTPGHEFHGNQYTEHEYSGTPSKPEIYKQRAEKATRAAKDADTSAGHSTAAHAHGVAALRSDRAGLKASTDYHLSMKRQHEDKASKLKEQGK